MSSNPPIPGSVYARWLKRPLDVIGASLLLVALAPVMALIAVLVLVTLGRPTTFVQERVGRGGTTFHILKFRTMRPDRRTRNDPIDGPDRRITHKSDDDPRHTTVGRLLRLLKVDELPQLFNVVGGSMSLIGPRPELVEVAERHALTDHPRHLVRPGITGAWQIAQGRSDHIHENVHIDAEYVASLTFRTDLSIIVGTARRAVRGARGFLRPATAADGATPMEPRATGRRSPSPASPPMPPRAPLPMQPRRSA